MEEIERWNETKCCLGLGTLMVDVQLVSSSPSLATSFVWMVFSFPLSLSLCYTLTSWYVSHTSRSSVSRDVCFIWMQWAMWRMYQQQQHQQQSAVVVLSWDAFLLLCILRLTCARLCEKSLSFVFPSFDCYSIHHHHRHRRHHRHLYLWSCVCFRWHCRRQQNDRRPISLSIFLHRKRRTRKKTKKQKWNFSPSVRSTDKQIKFNVKLLKMVSYSSSIRHTLSVCFCPR